MSQALRKCNVGSETNAGVILPASENYIPQAIDALKAEKVIAVPTDTIYGFACDAWYFLLVRFS